MSKTRYPRSGAQKGCAPADDDLASLAAIVRAYRTRYRACADEEFRGFREETSLRSAVRRAGLAQWPDGKRFDHQRRLPRQTLQAAQRSLLRADFSRCRDFDGLHSTVQHAILHIRGVGDLMVYDTACRIGAKLGLQPEKVYLHAGTRTGARALGLNHRARWLNREQLPQELRALKSHEVEDCLCIYKDRLKRVGF